MFSNCIRTQLDPDSPPEIYNAGWNIPNKDDSIPEALRLNHYYVFHNWINLIQQANSFKEKTIMTPNHIDLPLNLKNNTQSKEKAKPHNSI